MCYARLHDALHHEICNHARIGKHRLGSVPKAVTAPRSSAQVAAPLVSALEIVSAPTPPVHAVSAFSHFGLIEPASNKTETTVPLVTLAGENITILANVVHCIFTDFHGLVTPAWGITVLTSAGSQIDDIKAAVNVTALLNDNVSHASSTSATSGLSGPSAISSSGDVPPGEFYQDEDESSMQAARATKSQETSATAKMGITLTKKAIVVDVNGKTKADKKRTYTNDDIPFPPDSHSKDLKHFQETFIPDTVDWAATKENPFSAAAYPDFKPTIEAIWDQYFSAYSFTEAVEFLAASALQNWRSDIGKRALKIVKDRLNAMPNIEARRKWVAEQAHNLAFLYRDPATKLSLGSLPSCIRSPSALRTQKRRILRSPYWRGISCTRGDGIPSTEGVPRRGKKNALSFVPVPWADRAASYLPPIKSLTLQKWQEIFSLSGEFVYFKGNSVDLFEASSTDGGDSSDGYVDPRSQIVVSDDEPEGGDDA
ncbi:hypothetical protein B0H10DRAFT_2449149 [Mycena sp. CBHHK59/15]|nr:hypothetical protein B0H10DRAFT_2449149 [Mycena sp. CBHHK59/15]